MPTCGNTSRFPSSMSLSRVDASRVLGLFYPLTMPLGAYKEMSALPLPISQPPLAIGLSGDLHCMSLEEAMKMPFPVVHRPFFEARRARSNNNTVHKGVVLVRRERSTFNIARTNKTFKANHVSGVVQCLDCTKPRCIFSMDAPIRMKPIAIID